MAAELRPDAILATNTSSISITKIAAAALKEGLSASSPEGKQSASRVVGARSALFLFLKYLMFALARTAFL